jgi:uncharacterized membrane protein YdbT with pleckstrin-like domain
MAHSFHPHPVVAMAKVLLAALVLTGAFLALREYVERILIPLLVSIWVAGVAFVLIAYLSSRFRTLTLEENSLLYQSGIISTQRVMLPYSKITETGYAQDLIQRIFGVGTLNVDTAGGSSVAVHMPDVRHDDMKRILSEIRAKSGKGDGT